MANALWTHMLPQFLFLSILLPRKNILKTYIFRWWPCHSKHVGVTHPPQYMMMSSNGSVFHVTGHLCREFTGPSEFPAQRPVTQSFDVFFDLRLNKQLSKQSWGWWFETLSGPLWSHCNDLHITDRNFTAQFTYWGVVMLNLWPTMSTNDC